MSRSGVFDEFAQSLKAVANGRRLELLEIMAQAERSVDQLARLTDMAVTTTSAHLQTLNRAGLVSRRRSGNVVFYQLAGDDVARLYVAAKKLALARYPRMREELMDYLDEPGNQAPVSVAAAVTQSMFVIDVRPAKEYEAGHFPGAVSFPLADLGARTHEIPADEVVVVYCRGEFCRLAHDAVVLLREQDIDARAMDEGIVEWRASGDISLERA